MEIVDVEEKLNNELKTDMKGMKDGFVQVGEKKWFYPSKYRDVAEDLKNFKVRSDDIWIMGYPRSGTTLTEELVWRLSHNTDSHGSKKGGSGEKVEFFEMDMVITEKTIQEIVQRFPEEKDHFEHLKNTLNVLRSYKTRRVIKTHLPFELLPTDILKKGCKIIYLCRYPKDVSVSYFHLQQINRTTNFCADFQKFWEYFRNGHSMFGPYFEHVQQGFEKIGTKNFMFTFYEEFAKDNRGHIKKLAEFLEMSLTDNDVEKLEEFISFKNFQKIKFGHAKNTNNEPVNFVRKGNVGGWRGYFTQEMNDDADAWIEANTRKIGFKYPQLK